MLLNSLKFCANRKCFQVLQFSFRQCMVGLNIGNLNAKFNDEEQQQILNTLNTADVEHLSQLGIPLNRLKKIKTWQHKRGSFKTLLDVLEVDGLGIKVLEKICTDIITKDVTVSLTNHTKNRRQYLSPSLTKDVLQNFTNATGLHLGPAGISWAKISKDDELLNWSFFKFSESTKKALPLDTFKMVLSVLAEIPPAGIYVFEQPPHRASLGTSQNKSHNQHLEVVSMLLSLINTSPVHNLNLSNGNNHSPDIQNCVYYLRSNVSARLFRTLMGTERVSSTLPVTKLMEGNTSIDFPWKLKIGTSFKDDYSSKNAIGKELLGQALLLTVAFMEICVHRNPSILAMASRSKKVLGEKNNL